MPDFLTGAAAVKAWDLVDANKERLVHAPVGFAVILFAATLVLTAVVVFVFRTYA